MAFYVFYFPACCLIFRHTEISTSDYLPKAKPISRMGNRHGIGALSALNAFKTLIAD